MKLKWEIHDASVIDASHGDVKECLDTVNETRKETANRFLTGFLLGVIVIAPVLAFAADPMRIDAAVPTSSNKDSTTVEVTGHFDGSQEVLFLSVNTRLKDGTTGAPPASTPGIVKAGDFKQPVLLGAPREKLAGTSFVVVKVLTIKGVAIQEKVFPWPAEWGGEKPLAFWSNKDRLALGAPVHRDVDVWQMFYEGRFAELEALAAQWLDGTKVLPDDGYPLLFDLDKGLRQAMANRDSEANDKSIKAWAKAFPQSLLPRYARVYWWVNEAHLLSPYRPDERTDKQITAAHNRRIKAADAELIAMKTGGRPPASPLWHQLRMQQAILLLRPDAEIDAIYEAGIKAYPTYAPIYWLRAQDWTNELRGHDDGHKIAPRVARVAKQMEAGTEPVYGHGGPAIMMIHLQSGMSLEFDILNNGMANWERLRQSFRDLVARYPSDIHLNYFASFACRAGDREAYFTVRPRIAGRILKPAWRSNASPDLCDSRYLTPS